MLCIHLELQKYNRRPLSLQKDNSSCLKLHIVKADYFETLNTFQNGCKNWNRTSSKNNGNKASKLMLKIVVLIGNTTLYHLKSH
jgi:hypothetical protein